MAAKVYEVTVNYKVNEASTGTFYAESEEQAQEFALLWFRKTHTDRCCEPVCENVVEKP